MGDVHAGRGVGHDLVGARLPVDQVGVGHPHHRQVLVRLAAAVARRRAALLAGPQAVPHVVHQHAVLDQDVALGRAALVVDGEAAPLTTHRAVVDQGHERRRHLLADAAGEHRRTLGHQVGLEAVAARLVEHHATAAGADDDGHLAGGRRAGTELGDRPVGGATGELLDVVAVEQLEPDGVAHRLTAGLHARVAGRDARDGEHRADLVVGRQGAVGVGHQDAAHRVGVPGGDLGDGAALRAGHLVGRGEQLDLAGLGDVAREDGHHVGAGGAGLGEGHDGRAGTGAAGCCCRGAGRSEQALLGQVRRVGEARGLPHDDPDPGAAVTARGELLDLAVVEQRGGRTAVLHEDLGELGALGKAFGEYSFDRGLLDHVGSLPGMLQVVESPPGCDR